MARVHFGLETDFRSSVQHLFREQSLRILDLLPEADIQHIGSTAIPGSLTKGDLDIQVRVPHELFGQADRILAQLYHRNLGSIRTSAFASFKDDTTSPPLGIQLTVRNSDYDFFWKIRDVLIRHPAFQEKYDALKSRFQDGDMDDYRQAKSQFLEWLLTTHQYESIARDS